ncbi:hypothetical protein [Agromyces sp. SYSU T00266]|uniref:hypothetical protein n=1 Tax=Agromyces zhanjiangensis TaxID=3158562 RepID=UPI00339113C0
MSTTRTDPEVGRAAVVWAWVCVGLIPVAYVVATLVGGALLAASGGAEGAAERPPASVVLPIGLLSVAIMVLPAVGAAVLGLRAARRGRRSGIAAAVIGAVVAIGGIVLNLLAYLFG